MTSQFDKNIQDAIVRVHCGSGERGTGFFISPELVLTARHVVVGAINNTKTPVTIYVAGSSKSINCITKSLAPDGVQCDIAVLNCIDYNHPKEKCLKLLTSEFEANQELHVLGYPKEVGMGHDSIDTKISYREEVSGKEYDREVVVTDGLILKSYKGFSGSPVLNCCGSVVGVVTDQIYRSLGFASITNLQSGLDSFEKKLPFSTDWRSEDFSVYGEGRCHKMIAKQVQAAGERYDKENNVENKYLKSKLKDFCNYKLYKEKKERVTEIENEILTKYVSFITIKYQKGDYAKLLEHYSLKKGKGQIKKLFNSNQRSELHVYISEMKQLLDWIDMNNNQYFCINGMAGCGKTHTLCDFALNETNGFNTYLLYGSQFRSSGNVEKQICNLLGFDADDLTNLNKQMATHNRYGIIVIDALNEGAGDKYWQAALWQLRSALRELKFLKMVVSIRNPYHNTILKNHEEKEWFKYQLQGFEEVSKAVKKYFDSYHMDKKYAEIYSKELMNPLFLKIFCMIFHKLLPEERDHLNQLILFRYYVATRNEKVSEITDEDPYRNIAQRYLEKLANYSLYYQSCGLISRKKAMQYADQICRGRLWKQNLMKAMLDENLLLDTLSDSDENQIMFGYEKMADFYKAEQLLKSKMNDEQCIQFLVDSVKRIDKMEGNINESKFFNFVAALINIWHRPTNFIDHPKVVKYLSGTFEMASTYSGGKYTSILRENIRKNVERINPENFISDLKDIEYEDFIRILHERLLRLEMSERDILWSEQVNRLFDWFQNNFPQFEIDFKSEEVRHKMLILYTWMLTSSYPIARAQIIRKIFKYLMRFNEDALLLMQMFAMCNDPYVIQGLYAAIYGCTLKIRDTKWVRNVASQVYDLFYNNSFVIPDIIIRKWTLKILERAYHLDSSIDYWLKTKPPYNNGENSLLKLKPVNVEDKDLFGACHGGLSLWTSIFGFADFNRYIIGTNSRVESNVFYNILQDGTAKGISLDDIKNWIARTILNMGWNIDLAKIDDGRSSKGRFSNTTERMGKKYQWLGLYKVDALMCDYYKMVNCNKYVRNPKPTDFEQYPYPWYTGDQQYFDPTLSEATDESEYPQIEINAKRRMTIDNTPIYNVWLKKREQKPLFNCCFESMGDEWIILHHYSSEKKQQVDGEKEIFMFYNSAFIRNEDAPNFEEWAKKQNFYGRWMPEVRNGDTETLWNEYPWADSCKYKERGSWERPSNNCPCEISLSYECLLQEDMIGIDDRESIQGDVYAPCSDIMYKMNLYTQERGIVRTLDEKMIADEKDIVSFNLLPSYNGGNGLVVRRSVLDEYMNAEGLTLFYFLLGEKTAHEEKTESSYAMQRYTGAAKYDATRGASIIQEIMTEEEYTSKFSDCSS